MDKPKADLKGFFVCKLCRAICKDGSDEVGPFGPNSCAPAYAPRKQVVDCLGIHCDRPCHLQQEESSLSIDQLVKLVVYLGNEVNMHIYKKADEL